MAEILASEAEKNVKIEDKRARRGKNEVEDQN